MPARLLLSRPIAMVFHMHSIYIQSPLHSDSNGTSYALHCTPSGLKWHFSHTPSALQMHCNFDSFALQFNSHVNSIWTPLARILIWYTFGTNLFGRGHLGDILHNFDANRGDIHRPLFGSTFCSPDEIGGGICEVLHRKDIFHHLLKSVGQFHWICTESIPDLHSDALQ